MDAQNIGGQPESEGGRVLRMYIRLRNIALENIGSDFKTIRAFAFVMIVAETGLGPDEVRKLEMDNLDPASSIGIVSCRTRGLDGESCISVNLQKAGSDVLAAYMEARRAFLEEYSFDSRYLFPSRITTNGIMPPEAVNGIVDTVSDICEEKVDIGLLRDIFGSQ
jgi:site-specific recombinase XerD